MKKQLLVSIMIAILLVSLCACGAAAKTDAASESTAQNTESAPYDFDAVMPEEEPLAPEASEEVSDASGVGTGANTTAADFTQKIIYTGYISIETTEFDRSLAALNDMVEQYGGFVENSNVTGSTHYNDDGTSNIINRYADYTVRIPCDKFDAFLQQSGTLGSVTSSSTNATNITSQYSDVEAQRKSLEAEETRLLELMEKAESVESLIALESSLRDVRYQIDSLTRTLDDWQRQVNYSTVNITLSEVALYTQLSAVNQSFGEKIAAALQRGWTRFVNGCAQLLFGILAYLPVLIILLIIALVLIVLIKRAKKRRLKKYAAMQAQQTQQAVTHSDQDDTPNG